MCQFTVSRYVKVFAVFAWMVMFGALQAGSAYAPQISKSNLLLPLEAPSLWVSPIEIDFGHVGIGETSDPLIVTIHNSGNANLGDFAGGGVYPPFSAYQNCAAGVLPGGTCQYTLSFSPTETGVFTATSNSSTNAGPFYIQLKGTGVGAGLHVTPLSLDFGYVMENNTSPEQVVTIRNTGMSTLTNFAGGGVYPPFSASQNCAAGVLPGESCQYFFEFSPTDTGIFTTTSNSSTNAGPFSIALQGHGRSNLLLGGQRVTPRSLDFGPVGIGLTSPTLLVTISNQSLFEIIDWAGGGVYPPFGAGQDCAGGLDPSESCNFYYTFSPTADGVFTTTSNVTNSSGSFTVELRGTGVGPKVSASQLGLDFGPVELGQTSLVQSVVIKNTGMARLEDWAGGGLNPPFSATQDCAGGIDPGETCQFYYSFSPNEFGRFSATSSVSTNGGSFSILLLGGVELPQAGMNFAPGTIGPGDTSTLEIAITNPNLSATLFDVSFANVFPPGLRVASPLIFAISPECGTPDFAPAVDATGLSFAGGTLKGGKTCVVSVNVTVDAKGSYTNSIQAVSTANGNSDSLSATLIVGFDIYLPFVRR